MNPSVRRAILSTAAILLAPAFAAAGNPGLPWPFLRHYDGSHLSRIALPLGGIGTGTVSLGGRGDLRDWEIMNRPAKGFNPGPGFFAITTGTPGGRRTTRLVQGPVEYEDYEGPSGARPSALPGLPRFRSCSFDAGYPFAQVNLSDRSVPCDVSIRAFNPFIPADPEGSGIPIAVIHFTVTNRTSGPLDITLCGSIQNFIGNDGTKTLAAGNRNTYRSSPGLTGIYMTTDGVDRGAEQFGSIAIATPDSGPVSYRTSWLPERWGTSLLDFWTDLGDDGTLTERHSASKTPWGSLALSRHLPPRGSCELTFFITWHFPNRFGWSPVSVGNYYATRYADAWEVVRRTAPDLGRLERETVRFARAFCAAPLPAEVKEAALFNLSTLRSQTCFRTADGTFYAWEGCGDNEGCCWGSCTHVWNYEQALPFLFGTLSQSMRRVEFGLETDSAGLMSFRAALPTDAKVWGKAAADGQMGCIMKLYRDWQLSGSGPLLDSLWPAAKRALEFCWIPGGWDADTNGVMEGAQHNTMDVEYYGPNGQIEIWYLGALRAAEEMALYAGEREFAGTCRSLFERGRAWTDARLFNGRYYRQIIQPPADSAHVAPGLVVGMGAADPKNPDYQLGEACLVDQLVGQYFAHVCGLGYLVDPSHVRTTLRSIMKYNFRGSLADHFNCMRTFALGDESALLMAAYPGGRPANPFPYFSEVMTGFEYTAATGMLYEGETKDALRCIESIRARYDGRKRNPYNEAECGYHYGRAMASWSAVLAMSGFHYSAVTGTLTFGALKGDLFWSTGYAYGTLQGSGTGRARRVTLRAIGGEVRFRTLVVTGVGQKRFGTEQRLTGGNSLVVNLSQ